MKLCTGNGKKFNIKLYDDATKKYKSYKLKSVSDSVPETFTLTINTKPTGVDAHQVSRVKSTYSEVPLGILTNGAAIYNGDILVQVASGADGYYSPTVNWITTVVNGDTIASVSAGNIFPYRIKYAAIDGDYSYTIYKNSTPIVINPDVSGEFRITATDIIDVEITSIDYYNYAIILNGTMMGSFVRVHGKDCDIKIG